MILSKEQAEARLNSPDNLANRIAEMRNGKRLSIDAPSSVATVTETRRAPKLSNQARAEIAKRAQSGLETLNEIAAAYGVTPGTISTIKRQAEKIDYEEKLARGPQSVETAVKELAVEKMMMAMGLITPDKLNKLQAERLASVASSMASIVGTVAPKVAQAQINLVVYAPEVRDEKHFKIVEIQNNSQE